MGENNIEPNNYEMGILKIKSFDEMTDISDSSKKLKLKIIYLG